MSDNFKFECRKLLDSNFKLSDSNLEVVRHCLTTSSLRVGSYQTVTGSCQNWKVSESESVRIGKCHNWKVSEFFQV